MGYAELLKDPRWQKKRLEIMERDEWTCQMCKDTEDTLTVHHKSYKMIDGKFADPWDYIDSDLITLCEVCHRAEEEVLGHHKKSAYYELRRCTDDSDAIMQVLTMVDAMYSRLCRRITDMDISFLMAVFSMVYEHSDGPEWWYQEVKEALEASRDIKT